MVEYGVPGRENWGSIGQFARQQSTELSTIQPVHRLTAVEGRHWTLGARCKIVALHSIGRQNTKIHTLAYSHDVGEITKWMSDPIKRQGDLVVSIDLVAGFEQAVVMDLTGGLPSALSRTLANAIRITSNTILNQQWVIENILRPGHDCSTIMDWNPSRDKIPSDVTSFLGTIS